MNKTAIRNFAVWARNKLINDVTYRAGLMGVTANGIADPLPQSTDNVQFFDIGMSEPYQITGEEIKQRKSLVEIIKRKEKDSDYATAFTSVVEEVAYTWFNRLIAIRFMEVNDYLPSHIRVLSSESGKLEPDLVTTPYDAELFFANGEEQIIQNLKNDNKLDEVFRMLFIKQCNALYVILPRLFENLSDYTELLLNVSFIDQDGVVYHLVHDISEDDFNVELGGQVEIIGWLYQYYNAELKDETFALLKQNVKVTKERVPSVTQLFTPDWIVRYMVENSLGKLWIENHPNESLKNEWKYYLDEAKQEVEVCQTLEKIKKERGDLNPTDIRVIDPCMGSGHILVYAFDLLIEIYESAGWSQRDAAKSIIENNIFGFDIDERAAQLAYFAVMMKARQYNRRILSDNTYCNVMAIKESNNFDRNVLQRLDDLHAVGAKLIETFIDAKEYGSILKIDISIDQLERLEMKLAEIEKISDYSNLFEQYEASVLVNELSVFVVQAKYLIQKYDAVITNPPYMGNGGMGEKLSAYVKKEYSISKSDMFAVFVEKCREFCKKNAFYSMITQPSLLFLTSFSELREKLVKEQTVESLLHMGRGIFGIDFGSTAFVIRNRKSTEYTGKYFKLHARTFQYIDEKDIARLFLEAKKDPEYRFDFSVYKNADDEEQFEGTDGKIKLFYCSKQSNFEKLPGVPFAYWLSERLVSCFAYKKIGDIANPKVGLQTGDNNRFIRLWEEIDISKSSIQGKGACKWYPYNKGGDFRKWYGNYEYVVNWGNDGYEIKNFKDSKGKLKSRPQNVDYYLRPAITWSFVSSTSFGVRYSPKEAIFDVAGSSVFPSEQDMMYITALMNSKLSTEFMTAQNPTMNFQAGNVSNIPIVIQEKERVEGLSAEAINISKKDWDSFETSWDFKKHPLI